VPDDPGQIENAIVPLVTAEAGIEFLGDVAEAGLDQLLSEGFWRDLPIVGTAVAVFKTARNVRDALFLKKLAKFMLEAREAPPSERHRFAAELTDPEKLRDAGEHLILLLERLDHMGKPGLVGRLFRARIMNEISQADFELMAGAVDRLLMQQLKDAVSFYASEPRPQFPPEKLQALAFVGLVRVIARGNGAGAFDAMMAGADLHYEPNDLGKDFVAIIGRA